MSVEIKNVKKPELQYPVARRRMTDSTVVVFTSRFTGVCIVPGHGARFGEHTEDWIAADNEGYWTHVEVTIKG